MDRLKTFNILARKSLYFLLHRRHKYALHIWLTCCNSGNNAMWKPRKFKYIYLMATLTIPSASAVYWTFGDELLNHSMTFLSSQRLAGVMLLLLLCSSIS